MSSDLETIRQWTRVILTITAICVTVFPLLYLFSPWYRSQLGRAMMLQSLSIAFAVDFSAVYAYWAFTENLRMLLIIRFFMFIFIAAASIYLTAMLVYYNIRPQKEDIPMSNKPFLSDVRYNQMKFAAQIVLPAIGALYFGLATIWDLPKAEEVVGTITTIDVFLGVILGLSTKRYKESGQAYDGALEIDESNTKIIHTLELTTSPEDLGKKDSIVLQVRPSQPKETEPYDV